MLALFLLPALAAAGEHPAVKIVALLENLQNQVKEEGQAEAVQYASFTTWCGDLTSNKKAAIAAATEQITIAESEIEALTADIEQLDVDLGHIATSVTQQEAARSEAASSRSGDNTAFLARKGDLEDTVTAVGEAITALEAAKPAELAQVSKTNKAVRKALALAAVYGPAKQAKIATGFLQKEDPVGSSLDSLPEQKTYVSKTGGVIDLLKDLKTKFEDELKEATGAEANAANAQTLADAAMGDSIDSAVQAKGIKEGIKSKKGQDKVTAGENLSDNQAAKVAAQGVLTQTETSCRTRAAEWEERTERRQGEVKAMGLAIEALQKVCDVRTPESKGVGELLQVSFLQKSVDPRAQIVNLLRTAAAKTKAKDLSKIADAIAKLSEQPRGSGVFDQIKNMIQKMIFHLMSEQTDEDNHKNWCDNELQKTNQSAEDKLDRKAMLQADIDSLTAEVDTLTADIAKNQQDVSLLDGQIAAETATRGEDHAENAATVKDSQDAQTAVANAIAVLTDFYKSTGAVEKESWEALVQTKAARRVAEEPEDPAEPELWTGGDDNKYTGTSGGSDVIGLLQTVASDFASMEAGAKSDETTQQDEHDTWLTTAQMDKAALEKDTDMKTSRREQQQQKLAAKNGDFAHNTKELDATLQYQSDLQPACVNGDSSYTDRKAARTAEIEALKEAQGILENAFNEQ